MKDFVEWLKGFLAKRSLARPSGAMLFRYRATRAEYFELRALFAAQLEMLRRRPRGIGPSVGSKGDSYDNALAETINGLYMAEVIHRRSRWKTFEAVEMATLE